MPVSDKNLILLGKIIRAHGYEGAVTLSADDHFSGELPEMEWVFIEIDGKPVPFFVSSFDEHASGNFVLKFEGYDSSEAMSEFTGCRVFVKYDDRYTEDEQASYPILEGYEIINQEKEFIGLVTKVMNLPMQYMLVLEGRDNRELLIPLNESWILEINKEEKVIIMDLPGGITEIND